MEVIRASTVPSIHLSMRPTTRLPTTSFGKTFIHLPLNPIPTSVFSSIQRKFARTRLYTATSSTISTEPVNPVEPELETQYQEEKYDWFSQWYAVMPVCDLDKRVPLAKKVLGLDVVVWWDRNESTWKVFNDSCPHRLAPLSEGRIDQWGRLQCVYHGWCFNGSGDCKFIPQAPRDGPPVNTFKKACVAVYPSTVQNDIVWFWPNTDPQYKDILTKKKPPYFPELDDPSYTTSMGNRDIAYGYEILIENIMDPSHVPYAHKGITLGQKPKNSVKADREGGKSLTVSTLVSSTDKGDTEGGKPLNMSVQKLDMNGFVAKQDWGGGTKFIAPSIFYAFPSDNVAAEGNGSASSDGTRKEQPSVISQQRSLLIFICIPVSPGNSRLIWAFPRNFGLWIDRILPQWIFHLGMNLVLDSDLYLLHVQEHKIMKVGPSNWQKACFVPTKADALVVGFRRWINKYSGGQIDWGTKFSGYLPSTPPKEQLMDRYWSHVVNCSSCSVAYKQLNALEVVLQVISIAAIGIIAITKQRIMSMAARTTLVCMAVLCFAASRWLSYFIYKNFHFHDYNHAFR